MLEPWNDKYWGDPPKKCPKCGNDLQLKAKKEEFDIHFYVVCGACSYSKTTNIISLAVVQYEANQNSMRNEINSTTKVVRLRIISEGIVSVYCTLMDGEYRLLVELDRDKLAMRKLDGVLAQLEMSNQAKKVAPEHIKLILERAIEEGDEKTLKYFERPTYPSIFAKKIFPKKPEKEQLKEFLDQCLPEFSEEDVEKIEIEFLQIKNHRVTNG